MTIATNNIETRYISEFTDDATTDAMELRVGEGDKGRTLTGYAARYNITSHDLGGWVEVIRPGAFKGSIQQNADVRSLIDHNAEKLLGRTSSGTLKLEEDARGLRFEVSLPNTSYANDLLESVKRGDVKSNSFGFRIPPGGDRAKQQGKTILRELLNVDLKEVSVVLSLPAYPGTSVAIRSLPDVVKITARPNYDAAVNRYRRLLAGC